MPDTGAGLVPIVTQTVALALGTYCATLRHSGHDYTRLLYTSLYIYTHFLAINPVFEKIRKIFQIDQFLFVQSI